MFMRLVATIGIVGIGVGLGAILASSKVQGWIIGLVVAAVTVILASLLWSSAALKRP
jgi:ribose 5-phosphate isomerase RpiB